MMSIRELEEEIIEIEKVKFEEKGYGEPIRCKDCRNKRKAEKRTSGFRR